MLATDITSWRFLISNGCHKRLAGDFQFYLLLADSGAIETVFFKIVVTVFSYSKLPSLLIAQAYPGSRTLP